METNKIKNIIMNNKKEKNKYYNKINLENDIINSFNKYINPNKKAYYSNFFKTKKGEYSYNDIFLGISVPNIKLVLKDYKYINLNEVKILLNSKYHEIRLLGVFILVFKYNLKFKDKNKLKNNKKEIFSFYLENINQINNWDLVDSSAYKIIGDYLFNYFYLNNNKSSNDKKDNLLFKLVKSNNFWKRRIAIVSTLYFIKSNKFDITIKLSEILLNDSEDLIHKAVGWMLREVGKKDKKYLIEFLNKYYNIMPRTMLRYSIEKLNKNEKIFYMKKS